jgi:uncharacterized protein
MRIAIVGSGIAGLTCAHVLGPRHDVVLFEADDRLGGHANTVTVDDPGAGPIGVDTGFIVHNDRNYPNLCRLFDELGVETVDTEMSFSVTDRAADLTYRATNLDTLFADRRNLARPHMWRMLADIVRFFRNARAFLAERDRLDAEGVDTGVGPTIGEWLAAGRYSRAFVDHHLVPMGAAVWSADPTTFDRFPAASLLRFLDNHGLLGLGDRPQWRGIVGGSRTYVAAIAERFDGEIRLGTAVTSIRRTHADAGADSAAGDAASGVGGVVVRVGDVDETFDRVVLACHSDQALELLADPTPAEKEVLCAIAYQPNVATLHTDTSVMPPARKAWASWNYERVDTAPGAPARATLTYDLTVLQRLPGSRRYLVSLNSDESIDPASVLARFGYEHPVFDAAAIEAQRRLHEIDGVDGVHYCGAWTGYGFHEDGMAGGLRVCEALGVRW